jgi:hypothetical protein
VASTTDARKEAEKDKEKDKERGGTASRAERRASTVSTTEGSSDSKAAAAAEGAGDASATPGVPGPASASVADLFAPVQTHDIVVKVGTGILVLIEDVLPVNFCFLYVQEADIGRVTALLALTATAMGDDTAEATVRRNGGYFPIFSALKHCRYW